ncbi:hypothetical protein [Acidisarcina polymorpha]|nr:hypothetical protein [Acidisarcina polymorpha]
MSIFKYFIDSKDKQHHDLAGILATFELREWDLAGTARPERKSTAAAPKDDKNEKKPLVAQTLSLVLLRNRPAAPVNGGYADPT